MIPATANPEDPFFYVCAGMLMLAMSYHFGASTATAQGPGNTAVGTSGVPGGGPLGITATVVTASQAHS